VQKKSLLLTEKLKKQRLPW